MPDRRSHRGAHPEDPVLFAPERFPVLRAAVDELAWLLSRGYPERAALKLVGDRHALRERQRRAVVRSVCSDDARARRARTERPLEGLQGTHVAVDAFNLVITLESALGGAFLFVGRDGCVRDLAGLHGTYRLVEETPAALALLTEALRRHRPASVTFFVDAPVSNSGRLRGRIEAAAAAAGLSGETVLVPDADPALTAHDGPVLTADSVVLDAVPVWVNLVGRLLARREVTARCVDLRTPAQRT